MATTANSHPIPSAIASSPRSLQKVVDVEADRVDSPWFASIPFQIQDVKKSGSLRTADNILDFSKHIYSNMIFRFSSTEYTLDKQGIDKLKADIKKASIDHCGCELACHYARKTANYKSWNLRCKYAFIYQGKKYNKEYDEMMLDLDYRVQTLHSDRNNCRPAPKEGETRPNRTDTVRRLSKDEPFCPFQISIYCDNVSYYLKGGVGCGIHQYHGRLNPTSQIRIPSKLIPLEERTNTAVLQLQVF